MDFRCSYLYRLKCVYFKAQLEKNIKNYDSDRRTRAPTHEPALRSTNDPRTRENIAPIHSDRRTRAPIHEEPLRSTNHRKTISVKCLDQPNTGNDFPENDFQNSQIAENIFLFRKLAFPENMYFPEIVLRQPNAPLA